MSGLLLLLVLPLAVWACPNGVGVEGGVGGVAGGQGTGAPAAPRPPAITALAVAPDAPILVVGASDGALRRGPLTDGVPAPASAGKLPGAVVGLDVGAGGLTVAISDAGHVGLLPPEAGEPRLLGRHEAGALAVALAPDGARAAVAGCDGAISIWALPEGKREFTLTGHEGPVAALAFAQGKLWSAGWDGTVRAWKLNGKSGKQTGKWGLGTRELASLAAAPAGAEQERLLVGSFDGGLTWIDPAAKKVAPRALPARPNAEWIHALAFSRHGKRAVAVAHAESLLLVLDPERGQVCALEQAQTPSVAAFAPDGGSLLVGRYDGSLGRVELPAEGKDAP